MSGEVSQQVEAAGSERVDLSTATFTAQRLRIDELVEGQESTVAGFVFALREFKHHAFAVLRDATGYLQLVLQKEEGKDLPVIGSTLKASGNLVAQKNSWNSLEMQVENYEVLSSPKDTPPLVLDRPPNESLDLHLDLRSISIRNPYVAAAFQLQALVGKIFRTSLEELGFLEIHTPKIVAGGTEGGAAVFKIDYFDRSASLAQSPQLYKQIAAGGFDRVYEIGAVYRAENSHTSRHLTEFTGLDFELGFIKDEHDVMDVEEHFVRKLAEAINAWDSTAKKLLQIEDIQIGEIPRISYQEALSLIDQLDTASPDKTFDKAVGDAVKQTTGSRFVFVYGYPTEEKPFYIMPLEDSPGFTRSFDLLFDGLEISSGGQRIHDYDQLVANMVRYGLNPAEYQGYLDAFKYGMPPHGGGGMGLERVAQRFAELPNIRQTTLFPRDVDRTQP